MAGIKANSVSVTMGDGDTAVDNSQAGYVVAEQITLSVTDGAPSSVSWGLSIPSASTAARSALSATTGTSVTFTPDVGGQYVVTANVDGTGYVLRISVTTSTVTALAGAIRFSPMTDTSVPTPALGVTLYYSSTQAAFSLKKDDGTVHTVDLTAA